MSSVWQFLDSQMAIFRRVRWSTMDVSQCWKQTGSDWSQMGQIREFLRSDSVHFGSATLTHFGSKSGHRVSDYPSVTKINMVKVKETWF